MKECLKFLVLLKDLNWQLPKTQSTTTSMRSSKVIAERAVCIVLYRGILMESWLVGKSLVGSHSLKNCQAKLTQELCRASQGVEVRLGSWRWDLGSVSQEPPCTGLLIRQAINCGPEFWDTPQRSDRLMSTIQLKNLPKTSKGNVQCCTRTPLKKAPFCLHACLFWMFTLFKINRPYLSGSQKLNVVSTIQYLIHIMHKLSCHCFLTNQQGGHLGSLPK